MARAFHVTCVPPAVGLYELSDGRFQLTEEGPVAPWMDGWQYLIVEEPLARFLEELGVPRLRYAPVEIFNRATGEQFQNFIRVYVEDSMTALEVHTESLRGTRLVVLDQTYHFVSARLKARLEASPFKYLRFSEGLSEFSGES